MTYITNSITIDDALCNGKPTIRGMRITVQTILEFLYAGDSKEDILYQYPMLKEKDIDDCLHFAILLMSKKYAIKPIQAVEYHA